jgi:hypothetical protein
LVYAVYIITSSVIFAGIMTINGLWRFGYYRIFSGKSMEDIPIGFHINVRNYNILPNIGENDSDDIAEINSILFE